MIKQLVATLSLLIVFGAQVQAEEDSCQALFVQTANGMSYANDQLTLIQANPTITWFCDRPVRQAGHLDFDTFIAQVSQGENSFADNPPNAALSVFSERKEEAAVVLTLLQKPQVRGDDLVYRVKVLEGIVPETGGRVVLFIDPIGRPLSPTSVAGVHRRHMRRAVLR